MQSTTNTPGTIPANTLTNTPGTVERDAGISTPLPLPEISHPAIGSTPQPNFTRVQVGDLVLYFSYETVIAFHAPGTGRVVTQNRWSTTTGKHLNWIDDGDKASRVPREQFENQLRAALAKGVTL